MSGGEPLNGIVGEEYLVDPDLNFSDLLGYDGARAPSAARLNCVARGCVNLQMKHCYALALLRGLACIPSVQAWVEQHGSSNACDGGECVLCMLNEDFARLAEEGEAFAPQITRHRSKWSADWSRCRQECSMEAFQRLMEKCQDVDESRASDFKDLANPASVLTYPAVRIFGTLLESNTMCDNAACKRFTAKIEMLTHVQVAVPKGPVVTLEVALDEAQRWERLRRSACPACKKDLRSKRLLVERWPSCLLIQVKRWKKGACGVRWVKDQHNLAFKPTLSRGGKNLHTIVFDYFGNV